MTIKEQLFKELELEYPDMVSKQIDYKEITSVDTLFDYLKVKKEEFLPYPKPVNKKQKSRNAFFIIQELTEVLNEGWIPDFNNQDEYKYYLYFKREKNSGGLGRVWVVYDYGYNFDDADLGSGCYFKTKELALHAGKHFLDIFIDYLPE